MARRGCGYNELALSLIYLMIFVELYKFDRIYTPLRSLFEVQELMVRFQTLRNGIGTAAKHRTRRWPH